MVKSSAIYDQERVGKIGNIMPMFTQVAKVGDEVLMGLEGEPCFPYQDRDRPTAVIQSIEKAPNNTSISLKMADGTTKTVDKYNIAPDCVWEFSEKSFEKVMERERVAAEKRAEAKIKPVTTEYRGSTSGGEVDMLRAELSAAQKKMQDFHNVYIATLNELVCDVCKLDTSNTTEFCQVFKKQYEEMINRSESKFRGVGEDDDVDSLGDESVVEQSDYF